MRDCELEKVLADMFAKHFEVPFWSDDEIGSRVSSQDRKEVFEMRHDEKEYVPLRISRLGKGEWVCCGSGLR